MAVNRQFRPPAALLCPRTAQKFRFRAGLAEWQSRNAWPISASAARMPEAHNGIVTVFGARAVSEILIVGCHHGWLGHIGYDRGGSPCRDSGGIWSAGSFLVRILLYLELWAGKCRNRAIERTGSNGGRRREWERAARAT